MTSSFPVSARKKYRITKIDHQVRIFDFTPGQWLGCLLVFYIGAIFMMSVDPHWRLGSIPIRMAIFLGVLSFLPLTNMAEIRPLRWWRRWAISLFKLPEDNLPAINWHQGEDANIGSMTADGSVVYHLKFSLSQLNALDFAHQQAIADAFFNSVDNSVREWQLFISPESEGDLIYVITSDLAELDTFKKVLTRHVKSALMADKDEIRKVLHRHLTPTARNSDSPVPGLRPGVSDALTLAACGFAQSKSHLLVDGLYAQTVSVTSLPPFTHFGIIDDIFRDYMQASVAIFFNSCDQGKVRKDLKTRYRMGSLPANTVKKSPILAETLETMVGLVEGRLTAVDMAIYASYYSHSLEESAEKFAKLHRAIDRFGGVIQPLDIEELNGLLTVLPLGKDRVGRRHRVTTSIASTFAPFIKSF